tara:strand:- start:24179 stop:28711 length:4533 start_codon:yes stop_codon:yes gene_type:complete
MRLGLFIPLCILIIFAFKSSYALADDVSKKDNLYDQVGELLQNDSYFRAGWTSLLESLKANSISEIISYNGGLATENLELAAQWNRELYKIYDELIVGFEDKMQGRRPLILISDGPSTSIEVGKIHTQNIIDGIAKRLKLSTQSLYVIVVSTRTLNEFGSVRDQIAGQLAHELTHIKNGDLDKSGASGFISRAHSKGNETAADLGAIEFCKGKFSLRSLINNFSRLQVVHSNKNKPSIVSTLTRAHPADEVRQNSSALSAIDLLMMYPQYDIAETKLKIPHFGLYSKIDYASAVERAQIVQILLSSSHKLNESEFMKLKISVRKLTPHESVEIQNEVLDRVMSQPSKDISLNASTVTDLLKLPNKLAEIDLQNTLTDSTFVRWFDQVGKFINEINLDMLSSKERESLFKLVLKPENTDYLIRHRQDGSVKQFFENVLVPIFKDTGMWAVFFDSPLSLELIRHLKQSSLPVTEHEVVNLESITRRHYTYFQNLPGSQSVYWYYQQAKKTYYSQVSINATNLGKDFVIDSILETLQTKELKGLETKFPKTISFENYKKKDDVKKLVLSLSQNFDWQIEFIQRLSSRIPPYSIFHNGFAGDFDLNDEIKKIFYRTLASERTTTEQKILIFKLLLKSNIHFDGKGMNFLSSAYKQFTPDQRRSLFYPKELLALTDDDFSKIQQKEHSGHEHNSILFRSGSYYVELVELFYKRGLEFPLTGKELSQLIKFFEATGQHYTLNTKSHVVKYLVSELIKHKSEVPFEEFAKSFQILLNRVAYPASRPAVQHVFPHQLDEFSNAFKESLQQTGTWDLRTVAKFADHNAMFLNLSTASVAELMEKHFEQILAIENRDYKLSSAQNMFKEFRKTYYLHVSHRTAYLNLFEKSLALMQVTPAEYKSFRSNALDVDGLSLDRPSILDKMLVDFGDGIIEWTMNQEPKNQLEFIDYIMNSEKPLPGWVTEETQKKSRNGEIAEYVSDVLEKVENLKSIYLRSDPVMQSAVISYFLTNSRRGLLQSTTHEDILLKRLTKGMSPNQTEMVMAFYRAMKKTEPNFYTHMLSRAVVLKNQNRGKSTDPSPLLVPVVEYFDVPGIKLAQLSHFGFDGAEKMEGFEKFYESAVVLSNSQILDHIAELYGDRFPAQWRFIKPLGFGSANYAVLIYDENEKREFVLNIPRKNIAAISSQKFTHFQTFLNHLNSELQGKGEVIELLGGLSKFLKRSMELEFDRARVFQRTKQASNIYRGRAKGWKFVPVQVGNVDANGVISMSRAQGESLASLEKSNPKLFRKSSEAIADFLGDRLLNQNETVRLNTNGDWHPGQFFVDRTTSQFSILDFGQESEMTENELIFAKDLLTILSADEFAKHTNFDRDQAFALLQKSLSEHMGVTLSAKRLDGFTHAMDRSTSMSRFIYLVSYLENQGIQVPVTSGHWIKEVNAILNFEREAGVKNRFSDKLKTELFNHLRSRRPDVKIKLNSIWGDRMARMKSLFTQAKQKTVSLFRKQKEAPTDESNACLKFYK